MIKGILNEYMVVCYMKMKKLNKQEALFLAFFLVLLLVILGFGRVEYHNELEKQFYPNVFLGYLDDQIYTNKKTVTIDQLPDWCQKMKIDAPLVVSFSNGANGRIGIFADLVYYENRFERRTWFSGKLLKRDAEYYYKQEGTLYLLPLDDTEIVWVELQQIKPMSYNYKEFRGNNTNN